MLGVGCVILSLALGACAGTRAVSGDADGARRQTASAPPPVVGARPPVLERPPGEREDGSIDLDLTYLAPNIEDHDGMGAYIHVTPEDMPLRIAIGTPRVPARYASRNATRDAAIEAIRLWEEGLQPWLPWFRLEFVGKDEEAPVRVQWKSRINGPWGGFGQIGYQVAEGRLRVGGSMEVSTTPMGSYGPDATLEIDHVRILIAHEFGHVLGLGHCHDCDSAMNYSYTSLGRVIVTELDALTFAALVQQPNGFRVDGQPLASLAEILQAEDREP